MTQIKWIYADFFYSICVNHDNPRHLRAKKITKMKKIFLITFLTTIILSIYSQSNRLTTEKGELLWQYSQHVEIDENNPNTVAVTFVFINGIKQTAISLRQERFLSEISWLETANHQVEKEERVDFITANLAPKDSLVLKYTLQQAHKLKKDEILAERAAILIMNEEFEIIKEIIPEQKFELQKSN